MKDDIRGVLLSSKKAMSIRCRSPAILSYCNSTKAIQET